MDSDLWQQIEALYSSALELPASDRADFLAVACAGNDALRLEVLSLLSAGEHADSFLEEPAVSLGLSLLAGRESLAGQTVGRYKLLELLGRGGMGEVYLAHDYSLKRRIALKLLPPYIGGDRERVRRFEQEARAASAISHPNVAHVYEIGGEDDRRYIAMEYVRGRTLREVLKQGPLEVRAALDVAVQVASALQAAHEAGVIHRDVKPENVMLRDDGYVKVLDFGLAKHIDNRSYAGEPEAPPFSSLHTAPEVFMGTSEYMSPEQVRRQPADERTDLWSLGVVLYEMLAGGRPFRGREAADVMVAILEREPEPLAEVAPGLPAAVCEFVSKSISKRPENRHPSAAGMAADLRRLIHMLDVSRPSPDAQPPAGSPAADPSANEPAEPLGVKESRAASPDESPRESARPFGMLERMADFYPGALVSKRVSTPEGGRHRARWLALLPLLLAGLYFGLPRGRWPEAAGAYANSRFERVDLSGEISDIVLSPDGKYVASVVTEEGKQALQIRELATASDLKIVPATGREYSGLSFSPDGNYVYYLEHQVERGNLYRVSKLGGGQRKILSDINTPVTFSPDGEHIAFIRHDAGDDTPNLIVARADGASERTLAKRTRADASAFLADMNGAGPVWSPDGKALACPSLSQSGGRREMNLEIVDAQSGKGARLNAGPWDDISCAAWLPDGSGLVLTARDTPDTPRQLKLVTYPGGEVRPLTNDANNYGRVSVSAADGLVLTLNVEERSGAWLVSPADGGRYAPLDLGRNGGVTEVAFAPDGGLVFAAFDGKQTHLWVRGAADRAARQLTFGPGNNFNPRVTRDGRYIVFASSRAGTLNVWRMDADGTRPTRLTSGRGEDSPSVTPESQWVIYRTPSGVWKVPLEGGSPSKLFDKNILFPVVSPDGRLLAYFANERPDSPRFQLEVYDLEAGGDVRVFAVPDTTNPFAGLGWTPDGRGLTYSSSAERAADLWAQPLGGGAPNRLTDFKEAEIQSFTWSGRDGKLACVRAVKAFVPTLIRPR
jgi:serine/threonine protein kinase/Tol biopolymer transport system component